MPQKSWSAGEDELRMKKNIRQLQIILQPQCTREDWLELYKVSSVGKISRPFRQRSDPAQRGHWQQQDHDFVKAVAV